MFPKHKNHHQHHHNHQNHHTDIKTTTSTSTSTTTNQNKSYFNCRHRTHTNVILLFCRKRFLLMMLALLLECSRTNGSNILDQNRNEIFYPVEYNNNNHDNDNSSNSNSMNTSSSNNTISSTSSSSNSSSSINSSNNNSRSISSSTNNENGQYLNSSKNEFSPMSNQVINRKMFTKSSQFKSFKNDDDDDDISIDHSNDKNNNSISSVQQSFQMTWQKSKKKSSVFSKSFNFLKTEESNRLNDNISSTRKINDAKNYPFNTAYNILKKSKSNSFQKFDQYNNGVEMNSTENDVGGIVHFEKFLLRYFENMLADQTYELFTGYKFDSNHLNRSIIANADVDNKDVQNNSKKFNSRSLDDTLSKEVQIFLQKQAVNINLPRAFETGRLFIFTGLKKILWPLFIGVQIAKTILLALFLPSILGSLGKMLGKGIISVSGFHHPSETVSDLDFKDNEYEFDPGTKYNDYMYQQPQSEASTNHFTQIYDANTINNNALSRFGFGDQKLTFINTPATDVYMKNSRPNTNMMPNIKNNFKIFHDIPASSLLLTNYDPFYSPLLSRLDSVFQQLGLGSGNEICREKLVCLMYANPAKYAPYSNLVSAQLSRELNELRKPSNDNPDILRFFKYMKSAKNGQDGINCEQAYDGCTSFKDSENPAMLTTYHEINKLVQARKFNK